MTNIDNTVWLGQWDDDNIAVSTRARRPGRSVTTYNNGTTLVPPPAHIQLHQASHLRYMYLWSADSRAVVYSVPAYVKIVFRGVL